MMKNIIFVLLMLSFYSYAENNDVVVLLPSFNEKGIDKWEKQIFSGETEYKLQLDENKNVLQARSNNAASGLVVKEKIDLLKTPYLNWSWKINKKFPPLSEQTKKGDDYVARIYVVKEGGFFPWNTKALNYVWSSLNKKENVWDNAYAGSNVKMLSIRTDSSEVNKWYFEKRNVYKDMIKYFGDKGSDKDNLKAYRFIDIIAIMTDTDNSGLIAESFYGDLSFSAR